nr:MAG TPA: hypothetical protein [Caudoviricetes sp.]
MGSDTEATSRRKTGSRQQGRRDCLSFVPLRSPARSTAAGSALKYQGAGVCISPFTTDR